MDKVSQPTGLKQLLQSISHTDVGIAEGKVIAINPLKVQLASDAKVIYSEVDIAVPQHLTTYNVNIVINEIPYSGTMQINNALKVGDNVFMMLSNAGKQIFILGRKG